MANVIINDTNLTNIANAIREKNGTTDTYKPSEMANAIAAIEAGGGGLELTDEELTYNFGFGDYSMTHGSSFEEGNNAWVIREFGNRVKIYTQPYLQYIFSSFPYEEFNANITMRTATNYSTLYSTFIHLFSSSQLKTITGSIKPVGKDVIVSGMLQTFYNCRKLRVINDNFVDANEYYWEYMAERDFGYMLGVFQNCYSLREIPKFFNKLYKTKDGSGLSSYQSDPCGYLYQNCYALNKIEDIPVFQSRRQSYSFSSNMWTSAFDNCHNLSKLTFQTNTDGTPVTAQWTNQVIDLSMYVGYVNGNNLYNYNSGITVNSQIPKTTEDRFLQIQWLNPSMNAEKLNDRHSFEAVSAKYGRTEAVETINSLPDTSAAGGNNTIKFKGAQGKYTDWMRCRTDDSTYDSSISTLTEEEIAVAAAKGWTVSLA